MIRSHPNRVSKGVSPPSNHDIQKSCSSNSSKYSTQQNKEDNISLPKWKNRVKEEVNVLVLLRLLQIFYILCLISTFVLC